MSDKLNLYSIEQEYQLLVQRIIDNDGVVEGDMDEALAINQNQFQVKGKAYGFIIKTLDYEIDVLDQELARLTALKESRVKTVTKLKEKLVEAMELYTITKLETPTLKISLKQSERVDADKDVISTEYLTKKVTYTLDKIKIKADIKAGKSIVGAVLTTHNNLQIK